MVDALQGKVAIVTGGTRGIGRAIARIFLQHGATVAITGVHHERLRGAEQELAALPGARQRVLAFETDVRDSHSVKSLVDETVRRAGGLDILVNNAGIGWVGNVESQEDDDWRRVIDTNVTGVFNCCRASIPHLRRRGGGWIINVSSLAGTNAFARGASYCASKAAVDVFSEALMQEVRHDGIRVSYVKPGSVDTGFMGQDESASWKLHPDDVARVVFDLVQHDRRSLPSRVEIRPSQPPRK
jgi:3-oxoacyl-[acyl-carrier protein] reductase